MPSLLSLCPGLGINADAAHAAGDEAKEDVGGSNEPEGEDVHNRAAVMRVVGAR